MTTDADLAHIRAAPIIGITGYAGAGKSSACDFFMRANNSVRRMAFATPLKEMMNTLLYKSVLPPDHPFGAAHYISDPEGKTKPLPQIHNLTGRRLMQTLGTEWGRNTLYEDFWVDIVRGKWERMNGNRFLSHSPVRPKAVIDDLRYANEAAMVRSYDGIVLQIIREGTGPANHASEKLDFTPDIVIENNGTKEELFAALQEVWGDAVAWTTQHSKSPGRPKKVKPESD